MIDLKAIRAAAEADLECPIEYWEASISEIQSATLIYLLDRLEAAEVEVIEQARLLGISAEKELSLMAKLEAALAEPAVEDSQCK